MTVPNAQEQRRSVYLVFLPLLLICLIFEIFRLPEVLAAYRPDLLTLVLIYFSVFDPRRVNIEIAWLCGLVVDLLTGAPLGINGLSYALEVYLVVSQFRRFALFAKWQQIIIIALVTFLGQVLGFWVGHLIGQTVYEVSFIGPTATTAILWPAAALVCALLCRSFAVNPAVERKDK